MSKPVRAFIAVRVAATRPLRQLIAQLAALGKAVKAVDADELHVTLKFLGDTDPAELGKIGSVVEAVAETKSPFELSICGIGAFPHLQRPSVIFANLENAQPLSHMAAELENRLFELGVPKEGRSFSAHLTVARVKQRPPDQLHVICQQHQSTEFGAAAISQLELLQSELQPNGPRYTVLASAELGAS